MTIEVTAAYIWDCIVVPALSTLILVPMFGPVMVILSVLLMVCVGHLYFILRGIWTDLK